MAGGGSLLSFPALLATGYSALNANITNTVALLPGYAGGSLGYRRELRGQRSRVVSLGVVSCLGGLVGAVLLVHSPPALFRRLVPGLILIGTALLAVQPWITRWIGGRRTTAAHRSVPALVAQFAVSIYGGYFGAGLGVIMLAVLAAALDDHLQRLNALKGVLSLLVTTVAAIFFVAAAPIAWTAVAVMAPAALVGGQLGVIVARRLHPGVLRALVLLVGTAVGVRLLFA